MNNTKNLESENEPLDSSNQLKRRISIDHKVQSPQEINPSFQNQKSTGSASADSGVESGFESTWNKKNSDEQLKPTIEYIVYPQRWWILFTVVTLNLANMAHWVSFPSVGSIAAKYYEVSGEKMDQIPTISAALGVPFCIIATYVVERFGLRLGLNIGGILTGVGGLMCCLSSIEGLKPVLPEDEKYARYLLALIGQGITGIACPFISCVPTKISQHWFNDEQRTLSTILLGMSSVMGISLGQIITPLIIKNAEDIQMMNIIWFVPAAMGAIITVFKVTSNLPPTPPSLSAADALLHRTAIERKYWRCNMKKLFSNFSFIVMLCFLGGAMGYATALFAKLEQLMCSKGYSTEIAGLSGSLMVIIGSIATIPMGVISYKTKKPVLVTKLCVVGIILSLGLLNYFIRFQNESGWNKFAIIISCISLGVFALGSYPLALELVVECTYPVDQAIGTCFVILSNNIQGVFMMQIENALSRHLPEDMKDKHTCATADYAMDYTMYLNFITIYMSVLCVIYIILFKTEMKRTNADVNSNMIKMEVLEQKDTEEEKALVQNTNV